MQLRSDDRGFLIGDPIKFDDALEDVSVIKDDVSAIRALLEQASKRVVVNSANASSKKDRSIAKDRNTDQRQLAGENNSVTTNVENTHTTINNIGDIIEVDNANTYQPADIKVPTKAGVTTSAPGKDESQAGKPSSKVIREQKETQSSPVKAEELPAFKKPDISPIAPQIEAVSASPKAVRGKNGRFVSSGSDDDNDSGGGIVSTLTQGFRDALDSTGSKITDAIDDTKAEELPAFKKPDISPIAPQIEAVSASPKAVRGKNGRFVSSGSDDDNDSGGGIVSTLTQGFRDALDSTGSKITDAIDDTSELDPTIDALHEVKGALTPVTSVVEPMGRGLMSIFGRGEEAEKKRFYHRILNNLKWLRGDAKQHHVREYDKLKALEEGQSEESTGFIKWIAMLGTLIAGLFAGLGKVVSGIMRKMGLLTAARAMGNLVGGIGAGRSRKRIREATGKPVGSRAPPGAVITRSDKGGKPTGKNYRAGPVAAGGKVAGGKVAGIGKGLLKKVPWLGGLVALGSIIATESSDITRRDKDIANGGSVGMVGGGLGGAAIGAAIGTAILPGIGTAIGAAAGAFFGGEAGAIIGEKAGAFWNDMREQGIATAIKNNFSSWVDDLKSTQIGAFIVSHAETALNMMVSGWNESRAIFESAWDGVQEWSGRQLDALNDWVKSWSGLDLKQIITDAIKGITDFAEPLVSKGKEAINVVVETVAPVTNAITEKANGAINTIKEAGSSFWGFITGDSSSEDSSTKPHTGATKENQSSRSKTGKFNETDFAVGFQGGSNITGMTDAETRAYAANTAKTESQGNQHAVNNFGYMGQYQFGAAALVDAGLVDRKKYQAAKKHSGKNWFSKKNGGHHQFLMDESNWKLKGGHKTFLADKALQDREFVKYTNRNLKGGFRSGAVNKNSGAAKLAGYAKASHLKGVGGANKLFIHGKDSADAYGTSTSKYMRQGSASVLNAGKVTQAMQMSNRKVEVATRSPAVPAKTAVVPQRSVKATTVTLPKAPFVGPPPKPVESAGKQRDSKVAAQQPPIPDVSRDVPNRSIAHAVSGGMTGWGKNNLLGS